MVSGILSTCILLFILAVQNTSGKATNLERQKRAPPFSVPRFDLPFDLGKVVDMIASVNTANDNLELDPAYKEEYIKLFVRLLQDAMRENPAIGQNFLAYPRSGRSSPLGMARDTRAMMFGYPRLGRSGNGFGEECCPIGVKSVTNLFEANDVCIADSCCSGLKEMTQMVNLRHHTAFTLCVPNECDEKTIQ